MTTLATMRARILDEIGDSTLATQADRAIQSAIAHYEGERFWFKEERATAATVAGTEFYALPTDFQEIDSLLITVSGNRYPLTQRDWDYIENVSVVTTSHSQPQDFAIYDEQIRLYPLPDAVYTLTMSYVKSLAVLAADNDANAWMTSGERLIRQRAKWDLFTNVLMDDGNAARSKASELDERDNLVGRTTRRVSAGRIRATVF